MNSDLPPAPAADATSRTGDPPTISVLLTCYNEAGSIVRTLEHLVSALTSAVPSWEILIYDDASTDDSARVLAEYLQARPECRDQVRVERRARNCGFVQNVADGACQARGRYFWVVGGDDTVPQETMVALLRRLGEADLVIPLVERYRGRSIFRRVVSRTYTGIVNLLSGASIGYYNGSSLYPRAAFVGELPHVHGFGYSAEMITRLLAKGASYVEVPVVYNEGAKAHSTALKWRNLQEVCWFFLRLIRTRVRGG